MLKNAPKFAIYEVLLSPRLVVCNLGPRNYFNYLPHKSALYEECAKTCCACFDF